MKIIHCADLHLDSALTTNLKKEKRIERKAEILHTFVRMVQYAKENSVDAILIAGDLFDTGVISQTAANTVSQALIQYPEIDFYYLKGNHDGEGFIETLKEIPKNLKLFSKEWTGYCAGKTMEEKPVMIWGKEPDETMEGAFEEFPFDPSAFNIVLLHGQECEYETKGRREQIPLRKLRNRGIDYLALGHVHEYKKEKLDKRGVYCYSGCLEGRGFDECGDHGFVLLTIDEDGTAKEEFVPFSYRSFYSLFVDVTGAMSTQEVLEKICVMWDQYDYDLNSIVKVTLTGELPVTCELHLSLLKKMMEGWCWDLRLYDETRWQVDPEEYMYDESLRGEFVRLVAKSDLTEDEKASVIRYGLLSLAGEEIL